MQAPKRKCDHNKNKDPNCPICLKRQVVFNMKKTLIKDSFFGSAPAPFVGRWNYPNINVGILSPQHMGEENWKYDAPKHWSKNHYKIPSLVNMRSELINAMFKANVKDVTKTSKYLDLSKDVGMASKPVDIEVKLEKAPIFAQNFDKLMAPTGPKAIIQKADITSNPKIHKKVDKVHDDVDWKANDALRYLYKNNFDENFLSKLLSIGTIGVKKNRKLVPTRWSITAVDDSLGKNLIDQIKTYNTTGYEAYFGSYLGNYYLILLFPKVWSYELFEMAVEKKVNPWSRKGLQYATDFENYNGRNQYATETAGGYYTPRLAVLEHLIKRKKQASVLALRFITDEYTTPLGVWVTREACRNAMNSKPIEFSSMELMLKYTLNLAKKKYGLDVSLMLRKSKLLDLIKKQSSLKEFFQ